MSRRVIDIDDAMMRERLARALWDHDGQAMYSHPARWDEVTDTNDHADYLAAADAVLTVLAEVGVPAVEERSIADYIGCRPGDDPERPFRRWATSWEAAP